MPSATLSELAASLQAEAQQGTVSLDSDFLAQPVLDLIASSLLLKPPAIVLDATPSGIVVGSDASGTPTLWIEGAATPGTGAQTFLHLTSATVDVAIQQTTANDPTGYDLVLAVTLPDAWTFGDSLLPLAGLQPPGYLSTPSGQFLYFSSFQAPQPIPAFPSTAIAAVASAAPKILLRGLNYYADVGLAGIFALAEQLLGIGDVTVPLYGLVTPDEKEPGFDLRAHPSTAPLTIGFLELDVPWLGVKTQWVDPAKAPPVSLGEASVGERRLLAAGPPAPPPDPSPNVLFYVGAGIGIEPQSGSTPVGIEIDAVFVDPTATNVLLTVQAPPGDTLSLGSVAQKLLATDSGQLQGAAGTLESYLDSITLEGFTALVTPGASSPVQYVQAQIGTSPPWPIGSGNLAYSLDLTLTWTSFFFTPTPTWSASFEALLTVSADLAFDVTVTLPDLTITGTEHGTVDLQLSDLNKVFPELQIPDGLLDLQLSNFAVALAVDSGTGAVTSLSIFGVASLSIAPFGTPLLALRDVTIGLAVDPSATPASYTLNLDGTLALGTLELAGTATASNVPGTKTVFTLHLVNETVGSMLNHLIHLVDPTYDISFPDPWDRFLDISLDAFVLEVDLTDEIVSLAYEAKIDLEFLVITTLELSYARGTSTTPSAVTITVEGTFLGIPFGGGSDNPPLAWDAMNEDPPAVPGKGSSLLDLRYAGLGQHIGFQGKQPETIEDVMTALKASVLPVQPGQLPKFGGGDGQLAFEADSKWLIGADLTVMDTVAISAIFNDPNLYGILITLSGEKAEIFAGLSFEILYRKVTDTIGVYHVELKLPDAMRNLQFGEVSITLPIVVLDVYTNGNFRVDFGFPRGLDFSNSFSIQVFPFVGYGGFYFALLDGSTSSRVPQITNGSFHPVIEFGVALSIGVGKTIDEGILKGGLSVTVIGILEGVLAWFHPTDTSPEETYYWFQGTIAVVGKLYATIDFAIIQASVDVTAYLSVTLTIESHQPIYIEATASVSVRVSVKIIFFTIHLSFSATIQASFTIGSATPTPWKLAAGGGQSSDAGLRQLRGQRTRHAAPALTARHRRALRRAAVAQTLTPITEWPAVLVLPQGAQTVQLWAIPSFTKAAAGAQGAEAVLLLGAENSIHPAAVTLAEHRTLVGEDPGSAAFNVLMQAMLGWGVYVETHPPIAAAPGGAVRSGGTTTITTTRPHGFPAGSTVTVAGVADASFDGAFAVTEVLGPTSFSYAHGGAADASSGGGIASSSSVSAAQLEDLRQQLGCGGTVAAAFDYGNLTAFLAANLTFDVSPAGAATDATGIAAFPMIPAISLSDTAGTAVDFGSFDAVDQAYQQNVRAYFQALQVQFQAASNGTGGGPAAALAATGDPASMATVVFSQYFAMLMSQGVKAAIDLLAAFPFTTPGTPASIAELGQAAGDPGLASEPLRVVSPNQGAAVLQEGAAIDLPDVVHQVRSGETLAGIASALAALGALDAGGEPYSAAAVLAANHDAAVFNAGTSVGYTGLTYTSQPADTLDLVATRLLVRLGGPALVNSLPGLAGTVQALLTLNPSLTSPSEPIDAGTAIVLPGSGSYTAVAGDTPALVAAYLVAPATGALSPAPLVTALLTANPGLPVTDPTQAQPTDTALAIPALERAMAPGDTVDTIATALIAPVEAIDAALLAVPAATPLLSPQAVLAVPMLYRVGAGDTFGGIAAKLDLTLAGLAGRAALAAGLFAPGKPITIDDLPAIDVPGLMAGLLGEAEWNNASGLVSRFLLSGLRLPDPSDPAFGSLEPQQPADPASLAPIPTAPMFALTGQQYPIAAAPPDDYAITLSNTAGVPWLEFSSASSATFGLTADERTLLAEVAATPLDHGIQTLTRLALFQMAPARTALQRHIAWQAAELPTGWVDQASTGTPSIWTFPDALVLAIEQAYAVAPPPVLLYEVMVARDSAPDQPVTAAEASRYAWATLVNLTVSLPATDGPAPSVANAYVVEGADDTGAALLQQVQAALAAGTAATLYLLYQPDPTGSNPSGLASDRLDPACTYLIKTNLTTLTSSGGGDELLAAVDADPTGTYAAGLADPAGFVALLWEASITRSGGFYLSYANANGGAGLPRAVFGTGTSAQLSLLVVLDSQTPDVLLPFHNCAIVGDNVDTSTHTVFAQPAAYTVQQDDTLTTVMKSLDAKWQAGFSVTDVATLNADVPLLLLVGAELSIPMLSEPYAIGYGDTLAGIVASFGKQGVDFTLAQLVAEGTNATAAILAPGAQMQLAPGVLQPVTTVPPGTTGFEITRTNPDPDNLPYDELTPAQLVGTLFNLVAWSIAAGGAFAASGAGLPTTPAETLKPRSDGLTPRDFDDSAAVDWYYTQALAVAPFGGPQNGSVSPALPPAARNPYNGVGYDASAQQVNQVTLSLALQDVYGNAQPLPAPYDALEVPVGYYDDVVNLAAWPSLAMSYLVTAPATVSLDMTMQQARYVPSPSVKVGSALAAISADLASYTTIHFQLAQPDLAFTLQTTLALSVDGKTPTGYPLSKVPFLAFARGAYVYLAALATLAAVELDVSGTATTVQQVTEQYGVTAAQLLEANQDQLYSALFGDGTLQVPATYATVAGDSLQSIADRFGLTVPALATFDQDVALAPGTDLATPPPVRTVAATATDRLSDVASRAQASVAGLATANQSRTDVLAKGVVLTVGTQSYALGQPDSLQHAAEALGTTVPALAVANQYVAGLFVDGAALDVDDVLVARGDTLAKLAAPYPGGAGAFATLNATVADIFPTATSVQVGWNASPTGPTPSDTLLTFAQANHVTVAELAGANATAVLGDGARLEIPGTLQQTAATRYCTYSAAGADTVAGIAAKFGIQPAALVALNPDLPGLLAAGQTVTDATSGKSVGTQPDDSFQSIADRFQAQFGVTVTLDQLAADVATQAALLLGGGLWICPPMRGDAFGGNPAGTLAGLAAAYRPGTPDAVKAFGRTLATANAATLGLLAPGVALSAAGWPQPITTGAYETFNSLVNRLGEAGVRASVADVADAVWTAGGLIGSQASVVAAPPPAPPSNEQAVDPSFGSAIFQVLVDVVAARDASYVDPDFAGVPTVVAASSPIAPEHAPQGTGDDAPLTLRHFATELQGALAGIAVATGDPVAEGDAASTSPIFAVNFGSPHGPQLSYELAAAADVSYFAIPPLSRAPMGGAVPVIPYVTGQDPPLTDPAQSQTFQAVDLEVWLDTFLTAMDLFLSPAYAVPAYAASPTDVVAVVGAKQALADAISGRVASVLETGGGGSQAAAAEAMRQAMLQQLSSAFSVDTLVQVPVTVGSQSSDPDAAPRLSGKLVPDSSAGDEGVQAYSFSTAKIALTDPSSSATFLFSVKTPAQHRQVDVDMRYCVTELELPNPGSKIGDYEGSSWLQFVLPIAPSELRGLTIPVPLRAYPSPVALLTQTAVQSVGVPASATDLLGWNFDFVYQHDDAEQDTPLVEVAFDPASDGAQVTAPQDGTDLAAIFAQLAQFNAVYPALKDDLAKLTLLSPGTTNPATTAAVKAFGTLAGWVAGAFAPKALETAEFEPPPATFYYQLQKEQTQDESPTLTQLVVSSIDPVTNAPKANPVVLWPAAFVLLDGKEQPLVQVGTTATQATYSYPAGIPADAALAQRFAFAWQSGAQQQSPPATGGGPTLVAPQTFQFGNVNVLSEQNARAGVSIWRNYSLIETATTNPAFVYQTPIARFAASAFPSVQASSPIPIGAAPTSVAEALGTFLQQLVTAQNSWQPGETLTIRFGGGYSYVVAQTPGDPVQELAPVVPIFLVASADFQPATDWDWTVSTSFVCQVQAVVDAWQTANSPSTTGGAFVFDLTVYAARGQLQPLIHATTLRYALSG